MMYPETTQDCKFSVVWQHVTWPDSLALILKYVDNSIGQRTPFGMYTNDPSEKTAELSAAK